MCDSVVAGRTITFTTFTHSLLQAPAAGDEAKVNRLLALVGASRGGQDEQDGRVGASSRLA
jgi:hypothetical protein